MPSKTKEKLFSVTKKNLTLEYFNGTGKGGQHRNKHANCCRCKHPPSKAVGVCQEHRSKEQNTKEAFRRMADSVLFRKWIKIEVARTTGMLDEINEIVDKEIERVKVEVKEEGKWTQIDPNLLEGN